MDQAEIWVDVNWWDGGVPGERILRLGGEVFEEGCREGCEKCRLARGVMLGKDAGRDAGFPGEGCWEGWRLAKAARLQRGRSHYPIPRGLTEMQNVGSTAEKEKA